MVNFPSIANALGIRTECDILARIIREDIASDSHWCEVGCKSR